MYDTTWSSYYVGEPTVVRLGTKPRPKPKAPAEDATVRASRREGRGHRNRRRDFLRASSCGASALRTSSTNHAGTRVGRCVVASTVACVVQPAAIALAVTLDDVLVAEPCAADLGAAHPDGEDVVEHGCALVLEVDARRERLDAAFADRAVAARERRQVRDPRLLEPDDERRVVGDALRVRLGEADANVVA